MEFMEFNPVKMGSFRIRFCVREYVSSILVDWDEKK